MSRNVRLTLVQMRDAGSRDRSIEAAEQWIRQAAGDKANIVCLQELFNSPYPCQSEDHRHFDYAETIPGPSTEVFSALAKDLQIVIVVPIFERQSRRCLPQFSRRD